MANDAQKQQAESTTTAPEIWPEVMDLPCRLTVSMEIPHFTIRELLELGVNSLLDTRRREGAHVPVNVNGVMVGWAEFDVIDGRLAVRMTEMS